MTTLFAGAALVTPDGIVPEGWLEVEGERIVGLGAGAPPRAADVALGGGTLAPGFVDIHSHGGGGATVVGADPGAVATFAEAHRRCGTTTIVASLVSGHFDSLAHDVAVLAELTDAGVIAGTHLEGPWIAMEYKGAHDPGTLRDPDPEEVDRLIAIGRGTIRMVTLAPEHPHGIDAVRRFVDAGAIAAIGHTNATYDRVRAAIDAGASCTTHLYNAMRPVNHREPGPVVALTEDPRVTNELILDGVHVHPASAAFAVRAAEGRVLFVSDAMSAAGGEDGAYMLGDLEVLVVDGVARLVDGGAIAGSTLTLDRAVKFAIEQVGMSPPGLGRREPGGAMTGAPSADGGWARSASRAGAARHWPAVAREPRARVYVPAAVTDRSRHGLLGKEQP
ncbi:MAG: amidohydrolase family protein [Candidatus Nanopelagicales bacterium]|nr:amidohydrolase family protein [Candidatus Nanopelagicales bacterium]